MKLLIMQPPEG